MVDDLEALAAKGRDDDEIRELGEQVDAQNLADHEARQANEVIAESFREVHRNPHPLIAGALVTLVATFVLLYFASEKWVVILVVGGGVLFAIAVANIVLRDRAVAAGFRWVESLPFDFNRDDYIEILRTGRGATHLELAITFREEPPESERALYSDACAGAAELESREWKGRALIVRSGRLHSLWSETEHRASYFSNGIPHRWVKTLVDKVIRSLHRRGVVARVRIKETS